MADDLFVATSAVVNKKRHALKARFPPMTIFVDKQKFGLRGVAIDVITMMDVYFTDHRLYRLEMEII